MQNFAPRPRFLQAVTHLPLGYERPHPAPFIINRGWRYVAIELEKAALAPTRSVSDIALRNVLMLDPAGQCGQLGTAQALGYFYLDIARPPLGCEPAHQERCGHMKRMLSQFTFPATCDAYDAPVSDKADEPATSGLKARACRQLANLSDDAERKALWHERAEHWEKRATPKEPKPKT